MLNSRTAMAHAAPAIPKWRTSCTTVTALARAWASATVLATHVVGYSLSRFEIRMADAAASGEVRARMTRVVSASLHCSPRAASDTHAPFQTRSA